MSASQVSNFTAAVLPALLSVDRARLNFAGTNATWVTPPQNVVVSFGGGSAAWTASVNQAWLTVTPAFGTGATRVTVSINPALLPPSGTAVGAVTFSAPTATPKTASTAVYLTRVVAPTAPSGSFDTPNNNATNISGSIAVTGWAIDDIYVNQVLIYRDKISNEGVQPNGLVYIGIATFVSNARSDIEGLNPTLPYNYRGGWGYLMLTNAIPALSGPTGNGTIKLWAIATDIEGHNTTLGSKVITLNNAASKLPFGAVDTPGQGGSAVGVASNSGGVMTPQANIMVASPVHLTVYVDDAVVCVEVDHDEPVGHSPPPALGQVAWRDHGLAAGATPEHAGLGLLVPPGTAGAALAGIEPHRSEVQPGYAVGPAVGAAEMALVGAHRGCGTAVLTTAHHTHPIGRCRVMVSRTSN